MSSSTFTGPPRAVGPGLGSWCLKETRGGILALELCRWHLSLSGAERLLSDISRNIGLFSYSSNPGPSPFLSFAIMGKKKVVLKHLDVSLDDFDITSRLFVLIR